MDKIASFQINHLLLNPGIYVSRKDMAGDQVLTTFDIRMTKPNYEPVMNTEEIKRDGAGTVQQKNQNLLCSVLL